MDDADNVRGPAWHAWRSPGGYVLEYDSGDLGGHERRCAIDAAGFDRLRVDPGAFAAIVHAYGG